MFVITFIAGPLHAERRFVQALAHTYVHVRVDSRDRSLMRSGLAPHGLPVSIVRHNYEALAMNADGDMIYLYRGPSGATATTAGRSATHSSKP